jgi:hypothetical protein
MTATVRALRTGVDGADRQHGGATLSLFDTELRG